jgi:cytochrome P450
LRIADPLPQGDIVRIGPNTLSFNTAIALKTIYSQRKANVRKANWYRTLDAGSRIPNVFSQTDKADHAVRRRVLDHAFSDAALASAEDVILRRVKTWVSYLGNDDAAGDEIPIRNMKDWCDWLVFDLMGELTFSKNVGCIEKPENRVIPTVVSNSTRLVYIVRPDTTNWRSQSGQLI